ATIQLPFFDSRWIESSGMRDPMGRGKGSPHRSTDRPRAEPAGAARPASAVDGAAAPMADVAPAAIRTIFDLDTMRVVAEPLRARILGVMAERPSGSWSVGEIATAVGATRTRLYHHVAILVRHHLIRAVERRIVGRIVETRYRVVARSILL